MEKRERSRVARLVYSVPKRILAVLLAAVMVVANVGTELNVSYAATGEEINFQIRGADLIAAIDQAVMDNQEITEGDLDFTNGKTAEFEKLFFEEGQGKLFEIYPETEGGSMDAELRVFVRLPEDADDMYTVTGDEEIILLYVNNGSDTISCSTGIIRTVDGEEKVKKTKRITVRSFEDAFGDEEIDIISKPVEETQAPADSESQGADNGETADSVETGADTTESTAEGTEDSTEDSVAPDESEKADSTDAATDVTDGNQPDADKASQAEEDKALEDKVSEDKTSKDEASAEDKKEVSEDKAEDKEEKEDKAEADKHEKAEPEEKEPEKSAENADTVATIIRHYAPVVTDHEDGEAEEAAEAPEPEKEKEAEDVKEPVEEKEEKTEKETKETTTAADDTDSSDGDVTEPSTEESNGTTDETESVPAATDADQESTVAGSEDTSDAPSESGTVSGTTAAVETETEAQKPEDTVSRAGMSDLVGMGYCSTAKVYTTTVNQLKALDDFDGYKIMYEVFPEASARIVEGARGVNEGESLTFGVKNQTGYEVQNVTVNDETIEAESVTDNEDGTSTAWYTVPEIYEEQNVQVYMLENLEHPAFDKSVEVNGVTIRITAPEGVLPADTQIQAEEITEQVESAVSEKVAAESDDGTVVSTVIAYDINLVYDGIKLDNSWAEDGNNLVTVSFSGDRIEKASMDADEVEIVHLQTPTETVEAVSAAAELVGSEENRTVAEVPVLDNLTVNDIAIDSEGRQTVDVGGDKAVGELDFTTTHFSAYSFVFKNTPSLVIKNQLLDGSQNAENVMYEYELTLSPATGKERFYSIDADGNETAVNDVTKTDANQQEGAESVDANSVMYSFKVQPGGQIRVGNISLDTKYTVTQKAMAYNDFSGVTVENKKIGWSEVEGESATVVEKESFPFGYNSDRDAYGSLIERAGALMYAYKRCRAEDENNGNKVLRKQLLGLTDPNDNDLTNTKVRNKFLQDHYGSSNITNWPYASTQGFGDVLEAAQQYLDAKQNGWPNWKKVNLKNSYLNIYFHTKTSNIEDMEIIPYFVINTTVGEQWKAYVIYDDGYWYLHLGTDNNGKYIGKLISELDQNEDRFVSDLMEEEGMDKWLQLQPAEIQEPSYSFNDQTVEGSLMESGDIYFVTLTFSNKYNYKEADHNTTPDNGGSFQPDETLPDNENSSNPAPDNNGNNETTTPNTDADNNNAATTSPTGDGSSSGGSSGGSTAGRYQSNDAQSGPGVQEAMIAAQDIPLAALPSNASTEAIQAMTVIDDGEIPMAAIPKTGNQADSTHELTFLLSGVLLAVYTAISSKKKKES